MSSCNFGASLAAVLIHEGGFVNDPRDPGGATNKGITQQVYDDWRERHGDEKRSVRFIEEAEVENIYLNRYWRPLNGDRLPDGVDYCLFDFAVNSGVNRAARYLQRAVGVAEDGQIGPMTLGAAAATQPDRLINEICTLRQRYLEQLRTFATFGRGWTRRVAEVEARAKGMSA